MTCDHGYEIRAEWSLDQCRPCWRNQSPTLIASSKPVLRSLPCIHEESVHTFCPRGDELLHVRGCSIHDQCTRGPSAVQSCAACADYDPGATYEVQTDGRGIGDAVSQLYACCGLADATGKPVVMRSRHDLGWFAGVSHPGVTILPHNGTGIECNPNYPDQCRAANEGIVPTRSHWYCDRVADALGIARFSPVRPKTVVKPPTVREPGYAVVSAFSDHADRTWPAERWRELSGALYDRGVPVVAIDKPGGDERLRGVFGSTRATWIWGNPPEWTAGLIAHADRFYGNDSGMAHIAGLYGTPGAVAMTLFPYDFVFGDLTPSLAGAGRHGQPLSEVTVGDVLDAKTPAMSADVLALVGAKLGQRSESMAWLLREIESRFPDPRIVETGCVRSREDWSAGYATWLFGAWLDALGKGSLTTVDNDAAHLATARRLCRSWKRIDYVESCSAAYLRAGDGLIDVAYLDSMDTYVDGHAEHGLAESQAVESRMSPDGIIAFDDTPPDGAGGWTGKGRIAVPWLIARGWEVAPASGYQTVLMRN